MATNSVNRADAKPNTIYLGGPLTIIDDYVAGEDDIIPGDHIELYRDGTTHRKLWRKVLSATEATQIIIALDQPWMNGNIDHPYKTGYQLIAGALSSGSFFYGSVPSGQDLSNGELMAPNGGGTGLFKSASDTTADKNLARLQCMQEIGVVSARTRAKIQVLY